MSVYWFVGPLVLKREGVALQSHLSEHLRLYINEKHDFAKMSVNTKKKHFKNFKVPGDKGSCCRCDGKDAGCKLCERGLI